MIGRQDRASSSYVQGLAMLGCAAKMLFFFFEEARRRLDWSLPNELRIAAWPTCAKKGCRRDEWLDLIGYNDVTWRLNLVYKRSPLDRS